MPTLTPDQLAALAKTGVLNHEIEATLGRPMNATEKAAVGRGRVVWRLERQARQQKKRDSKAGAQRVREHRARERLIEYRDAEDAERRDRLEKEPEEWLAYYLPDRFPLPFGDVHRKIIKACIRAMTQGTSITVAAPRGFGKTALLWGMALFGVMTGLCRFPVVIGWKANAGLELLDQWLSAMSENERLIADYPCQCDPFAESTASNRLKGILRSISPEEKAGCDVRKGRGFVILPDVQEPTTGRKMKHCALAGASMNGSIKGLNVGMKTGESLRPDIVLMDDPQDEATADSEALVKKVIKKIDYGIRSLSGPRRRLTIMSAVTCVNIGDVSEHLLTRPGTEAIKTGQIVSWPIGWDARESESREAWDGWNDARLRGLGNLDGGKAARAHYRKNKETLTAGMAVSWNERYHAADGIRVGDPDAIYSAMWDFYDLGEMAFMAERQNMPIKEGVTLFTLAPKDIMARADKSRAPGDVPEWVRKIVAATDVNRSYALSTAVLGFGEDQRAAVLWYGLHDMTLPDQPTDAQTKAYIMKELEKHGQSVAGLRCRPDLWLIDGGGSPQDTVQTFCANAQRTCGLDALTAFGRAWNYFRAKQSDRKFEQAIIRSESRLKRWALYNKDYWQDIAIRAWLAAIGAPGSCDMPTGSHRNFAEQVCNERLIDKAPLAGGWAYKWEGVGPHDFGDCVYMAFVGAALLGIGTGGVLKQIEAPKKTGPWGASRPRWGANRKQWGAK